MKTLKKREPTYTDIDYTSNDGFLTYVWGPAFWFVLHTISFNYPNNPTKEEKEHYKNFVLSLQHVLPCKYCRINISKNFKKMPITDEVLENRTSFSKYMYELHNMVNVMLGKRPYLTFPEVRDRYENFRSRCTLGKASKKTTKTRKVRKGGKREKGCTRPFYGKKAKCVIHIVPHEKKTESLIIDKQCIKKSM